MKTKPTPKNPKARAAGRTKGSQQRVVLHIEYQRPGEKTWGLCEGPLWQPEDRHHAELMISWATAFPHRKARGYKFRIVQNEKLTP